MFVFCIKTFFKKNKKHIASILAAGTTLCIASLASLVYYLAAIPLLSSCANSSVAPTGGAKDTIAPVLLKMSPAQKTVNFKGREVVFTFNEYVQLKDQSKKFVISPPLPEKKPTLKIRGKSVAVKFPSLADSTTYYLDFGTSVVDVNESNPAKYLNFIFSTGNVLDTLVYAGRLVNSFTLEPVDGASVFFYEENLDSMVYLKNPSALTVADKEGVFILKGLKGKPYKMTAVVDKNMNMRYDAGVEPLAFADSLIVPLHLTENDSLEFKSLPVFKTFEEKVKRQSLTEYKRPQPRHILLAFNETNAVIESFELKGIEPSRIIAEPAPEGDTISYWISAREVGDTIEAKLIYLKTDTLNRLLPDTVKLKFTNEKLKRKPRRGADKDKDKADEDEIVPIAPSINANPARVVEHNVSLNFDTPLLRADMSKITLSKFDPAGKEKTPVKFNLHRDSIRLRNYILQAKWEVASKYEILILPEAFVDIYSITNDTITKAFETADPERFGKLTLSIDNSDRQYILQLVKDKKTVQEKKVKGGDAAFMYLDPGKYRVRVIEDANENGKWDTGSYREKRQAERVAFLVFSDDDEFLEMKSNREIEHAVNAASLFR